MLAGWDAEVMGCGKAYAWKGRPGYMYISPRGDLLVSVAPRATEGLVLYDKGRHGISASPVNSDFRSLPSKPYRLVPGARRPIASSPPPLFGASIGRYAPSSEAASPGFEQCRFTKHTGPSPFPESSRVEDRPLFAPGQSVDPAPTLAVVQFWEHPRLPRTPDLRLHPRHQSLLHALAPPPPKLLKVQHRRHREGGVRGAVDIPL